MIVILTNATEPRWHVQDLQRAAIGRGQQVRVCQWQHLTATLGSSTSHCPSEVRPDMSPVSPGPIWANDVCLSEARVILPRSIGPGSLEQIVLRMDLLAQLQYQGVAVFNSQRAIEMAVDKYLSLANMHRANLPIPPTIVCQRPAEAMQAFKTLGGDVILKPLFGSEGLGMIRLQNTQTASEAFDQSYQEGAVLYLQQFIEHAPPGSFPLGDGEATSKTAGGGDLRLFVLGGRVLCAMRRTSEHDWRTNIAQGGTAERYHPTEMETTLAIKAASVCQTDIGGVDLLVGKNGQTYVLEVNAIPGWRKLAEVTKVDVADHILGFVEKHLACPVDS